MSVNCANFGRGQDPLKMLEICRIGGARMV